MLVQNIVFYATAALLVFSGFMMIISRNPVRSALFLVLAFVASSVLWILLEAEFLGLVLVFVYVGAVMTLFLFVIMMLYLDWQHIRGGFVKYLPLGGLIVAAMVGLMIFIISPNHFGLLLPVEHGADYSNIKELGEVLYTQYAYPFELAAVLLLVAIISAISLSHQGKTKNKTQDVSKQVQANPDERVRLVKMPVEKKQ